VATDTFKRKDQGLSSSRAFSEVAFVAKVLLASGRAVSPLVVANGRPEQMIAAIDPSRILPSTLSPPAAEEIKAITILKQNCGACHSGSEYQHRLRCFPDYNKTNSFSFVEDPMEQKIGWLKGHRILTRIDPTCVLEKNGRLRPPSDGLRQKFYASDRDFVVKALRNRYFSADDHPYDLTKISELDRQVSEQIGGATP
jgi:hypothetical protein